MKECCYKKGFTLIELLVVILIVGVLTAIALSQYQKTVKKTQYTRMLPLIKYVVDAQKIYYLDHGTYAVSFDALGVNWPNDPSLIKSKCGLQSSLDYETRFVNNLCISLSKTPVDSVRVNIPRGWRYWSSGYYYLFFKYRGALPGLYCYEKSEEHCDSGLPVSINVSYGKFYKM